MRHMTRAIFIPSDYRQPALLGTRVVGLPNGPVRWLFPTDDPSKVNKAIQGGGILVPLHRDDDTPLEARRRPR